MTESIFHSILPKEEADRAQAISDIMLKAEVDLLAAGANHEAVKDLMKSVRLSRLAGRGNG